MTHTDYMLRAIRAAEKGIAKGQTPFGAVVVRDGSIIAEAHNCVWLTGDPTAYAEVVAIRQAASALKTIDLSGSVMYTTCEPCPMCLSASHWSKMSVVYYGAAIADAQRAGFCELAVPAKELARQGGSPIRVEEGPLREKCVQLFGQWQAAGLSKPY